MSGRVLVLGSINVDLLASAARLPGPGETVTADSVLRQLGGKGANQAVAASRAGAPTTLIGALGADREGTAMAAELERLGIDLGRVTRVASPTGCAIVVTSPCDNQIVVIPGANHSVDERHVDRIPIVEGDVCLAQMETPAGPTAAFFRRARARGATTILNAAPASEAVLSLLPSADILVVNESELALLARSEVGSEARDCELRDAIDRLALSPATAVVVTLGPRGVVVSRSGGLLRVPGRSANVVDTTGAGDCFCGYLAAALARGDGLELAAAEANVAASIAVGSVGAAASVPIRAHMLDSIDGSSEEK